MPPGGADEARVVAQVLAGDHTRPLLQRVGGVPPEVRRTAANVQAQGAELLGRLSGFATQAGFGQVRPRSCLFLYTSFSPEPQGLTLFSP